mmetsp:Transcript_13885/g.39149  ORF Transcript_13885/g.39149 Transcript_13885/m.39149 type:complete len:110 (+) Transcript_13885:765-1094(+)
MPAKAKKASWKNKKPILFWTPAIVRLISLNMAMLSKAAMIARATCSLNNNGRLQICLKLRVKQTLSSVVKGLYISTLQRLSKLLFLVPRLLAKDSSEGFRVSPDVKAGA